MHDHLDLTDLYLLANFRAVVGVYKSLLNIHCKSSHLSD